MVKIKQMQYLSYNANKWPQSLDLKAMVGSNGDPPPPMVQPTILLSHTLINKYFALIISIYAASNDVTFIAVQNFTNM